MAEPRFSFYTKFIYLFSAFFWLIFLQGKVVLAADLPNEMGLVPILEYHRIGEGERDFVRSKDNFKKDLDWLYNNDYVLIPLHDYLDQKVSIPAGKKPVIFTWDDSTKSQFNYLDDGTIDPESGVGIMDAFSKKHPDFGQASIYYLNATLFEQKGLAEKKLKYLLATGREIGNHTLNHTSLGKLPSGQIEAEFGGLLELVRKTLGTEVVLDTTAYPFGSVPKATESLDKITSGTFNGVSYNHRLGLLVGADPAVMPYSLKFEALYTPRIQAMDAEWKRWFSRVAGATLKQNNDEVFTPFVSDGMIDVISVPKGKWAERLDKNKVRQGLKVCVYEKIEECKSLSSSVNESEQSGVVSGESGVQLQPPPSPPEYRGGDSTLQPVTDLESSPSGNNKVSSGAVSTNIQPPLNTGGGTNPSYVGSYGYLDLLENFTARIKKNVLGVKDNLERFLPKIEWQNLPAELVRKDDKFYYTVQDGDTISKIVAKFLPYTSYYLPYQLVEALESANPDLIKNVKPGEALIVPNVEVFIIDVKPFVPFKKGIYWTGYTAGTKSAMQQLDTLLKSGGNMVVIDIKETEGKIFYDSKLPLPNELGLVRPLIPDLRKLVRTLHRRGVYVVARQVLFKDENLAKAKPQWMAKDKKTGQPVVSKEGLVWMDPSHPELQAYNLAIAKEVAGMGVDEVQFDYVRFPTSIDLSQTDFYYDENVLSREEVIAGFLAKVYKEIKPLGVNLSADVFGIVAWSNGIDARLIGQDITKMSRYLDAIYPMVYPSHFGPGYAGHANPGGEPYFFVAESCKKFLKLVADTGTEIRPWIQGFSWHATGFGTDYVAKQIQAVKDLDLGGYAIWSAGNKYEVSWGAMR